MTREAEMYARLAFRPDAGMLEDLPLEVQTQIRSAWGQLAPSEKDSVRALQQHLCEKWWRAKGLIE